MLSSRTLSRQCQASKAVHLMKVAYNGHERAFLRVRCLDDDKASTSEEAAVSMDWREFRAQMVMKGPSRLEGASSSPQNYALLEEQNPSLAAEGLWAHPIVKPESGCLLIASPDISRVRKDPLLGQAVIMVLQCSPEGTLGIVLNRPTSMVLGRDTSEGMSSQLQGAPLGLQTAFSRNRVYLGGKSSQHLLNVVHGMPGLSGAVQICPGVFMGGQMDAMEAVVSGKIPASHFKFFAGCVAWDDGQLEDEIKEGGWYLAACSRSLLLKQVIGLPTPLWVEVLALMGGDYAQLAREYYPTV